MPSPDQLVQQRALSQRAVAVPPYKLVVTRKPGLSEFLMGTRYTVSLYRGERYVSLKVAGTLAAVKRAGRQLVLDDLLNRQIECWETEFDFGGER